MHARQRLNNNKSSGVPIPLYTPPCPSLTHTLKRAVVASHMRYQLLESILPVVKTANMHFSSAKSVHIVSIPSCDNESDNEEDDDTDHADRNF